MHSGFLVGNFLFQYLFKSSHVVDASQQRQRVSRASEIARTKETPLRERERMIQNRAMYYAFVVFCLCV